MRHDFYVYVLLDPRKPGTYVYSDKLKFKYEPFYVGKGKGRRDISHFRPGNLRRDFKLFRNTRRLNKIRKILAEGYEPIIVRVKKATTEEIAFMLEAKAIEQIGRGKKGPLVNCTDGGEGTSGYRWTEEDKVYRSRLASAWHESLTPEERLALNGIMSEAQKKVRRRLTPDQKAKWAANISAAAKRRTPEERKAITEKFREAQHNMSARAKKLKSLKTSIGNKEFYANMSHEEREAHAEKYRQTSQHFWDNATQQQREERSESIKKAYAKKSKRSLKEKNAKISKAIAEKHANADPVDAIMRKYMVMCGVMLKNYGRHEDLELKERLRSRGRRFYSKPENLVHQPTVLREKVRALIV